MVLEIRPLKHEDFPAWLPLWDENNLGHRDEAVTAETWSRITDPDYPVYGLGAFEEGTLIGLVHYVLHPTTGSLRPVAYMQDVFTETRHRQKGVARRLVKEVAKIGANEKWARLYWLADESNEGAQALYKNLGVKLNFSLHVMPLD